VCSQPGPLQGTLRKSSISDLLPTRSKIRKNKPEVPKTAVQKASKNRLDIIQFTKYVKKWNLSKTTVFIMFSIHLRTDPGVMSTQKQLKNKPQTWHLKFITSSQEKNTKTDKTQGPMGSQNLQNITTKTQLWSLRCLLQCSCGALNHQLVAQGAKNKPPSY
jgi:hypothetical protein